jgi:hypothetical protein
MGLIFTPILCYNKPKGTINKPEYLSNYIGVINMQDFITNLEELINNARAKVIGQYESTYGANVEYASLLNQKWGFDWFELKHTDTSDEGKAVKAEGDRFRKGIKDWHSNPSTAWKQIREHARTDRYGKQVVATTEGETTEGEGSGDAKHNRSPELRNIEELTVLFKFNRRQESLSDNLKDCQRNIIKALESMGVDIGMIGD